MLKKKEKGANGIDLYECIRIIDYKKFLKKISSSKWTKLNMVNFFQKSGKNNLTKGDYGLNWD